QQCLSGVYARDGILPDRIGEIEYRPLRIGGGDRGTDEGTAADAASADGAVAAFGAVESAYRLSVDTIHRQPGVETVGAARDRWAEASTHRGHLVVRGGRIECAHDRGRVSATGGRTDRVGDGGHSAVGEDGGTTAAESKGAAGVCSRPGEQDRSGVDGLYAAGGPGSDGGTAGLRGELGRAVGGKAPGVCGG